jgi:nucleoside phosphorylase
LIHAYSLLRSDELQGKSPWMEHIARACERLKVQRPEPITDQLLASTQRRRIIPHPKDFGPEPRVFNGTIASANAVLKDPKKRDELRNRFGVRAVEMEGSGIADATWEWEKAGYFIVRGICDYCDKRNKGELGEHWQSYAAVVAAAFTRALIESLVLEQAL